MFVCFCINNVFTVFFMFSEGCFEQTRLLCRKAPPGYEGTVAEKFIKCVLSILTEIVCVSYPVQSSKRLKPFCFSGIFKWLFFCLGYQSGCQHFGKNDFVKIDVIILNKFAFSRMTQNWADFAEVWDILKFPLVQMLTLAYYLQMDKQTKIVANRIQSRHQIK